MQIHYLSLYEYDVAFKFLKKTIFREHIAKFISGSGAVLRVDV